MSYTLRLLPSAQKEFLQLPPALRAAVGRRFDELCINPRPPGAEALAGQLRGQLRVRVRDHRVVYYIEDPTREVFVTRVRPRSQAYK